MSKWTNILEAAYNRGYAAYYSGYRNYEVTEILRREWHTGYVAAKATEDFMPQQKQE